MSRRKKTTDERIAKMLENAFHDLIEQVTEAAGARKFLHVDGDGFKMSIVSFGGDRVGICITDGSGDVDTSSSAIICPDGARHAATGLRNGDCFSVVAGVDAFIGIAIEPDDNTDLNHFLFVVADGLKTSQIRVPMVDIESIASALDDAAEHAATAGAVDPAKLKESLTDAIRHRVHAILTEHERQANKDVN